MCQFYFDYFVKTFRQNETIFRAKRCNRLTECAELLVERADSRRSWCYCTLMAAGQFHQFDENKHTKFTLTRTLCHVRFYIESC